MGSGMTSRLKQLRTAVLATTHGRALHEFITSFLPYRQNRASRELWDARYESFLAENGAIMYRSMDETVETRKIWAQIAKRYVAQDSVALSNQNGGRWIVKVLGGLDRAARTSCRQA
jgi:hypothetical protein